MRHSRLLWATVAVSFVAISLFPVYTVFFLAPRFKELLVENTKQDAVQLASSFSALVVEEGRELQRGTLPTRMLDRLASQEGDRHLIKMRIFSPSGEIIYSTKPSEVGHLNEEAYFKEIAASGRGRAEIIPKQSRSLENEVVPLDLVETYVPITRGARLLGVFELYHDVSKERQDLNRLVYRSYGTLFVMAVSLLVLVLVSSFRAHRSMEERARAEEQLRLLSLTDDLTGLYNRRGFFALAEQQARMATRNHKPMMVISADLDGLKQINDTFGHKEGDAALAETAHLLRTSVRDADLVARMGGDEFALLLTRGEAEFDVGKLEGRLQAVVERHNGKGDRRYRISLSAGFACVEPARAHAFEECLHQADTMMYERKRQKKV